MGDPFASGRNSWAVDINTRLASIQRVEPRRPEPVTPITYVSAASAATVLTDATRIAQLEAKVGQLEKMVYDLTHKVKYIPTATNCLTSNAKTTIVGDKCNLHMLIYTLLAGDTIVVNPFGAPDARKLGPGMLTVTDKSGVTYSAQISLTDSIDVKLVGLQQLPYQVRITN